MQQCRSSLPCCEHVAHTLLFCASRVPRHAPCPLSPRFMAPSESPAAPGMKQEQGNRAPLLDPAGPRAPGGGGWRHRAGSGARREARGWYRDERAPLDGQDPAALLAPHVPEPRPPSRHGRWQGRAEGRQPGAAGRSHQGQQDKAEGKAKASGGVPVEPKRPWELFFFFFPFPCKRAA